MDDLDNDFGEMYAEVEVEAMNTVLDNVEEGEDESEDELNIVLNHDDDDAIKFKNDAIAFKNIRFQTPCNFSLPLSRTILDVNIDSLKHKPWNHPGVDITDFFNFGFNQDSWKRYCNNLYEANTVINKRKVSSSNFTSQDTLRHPISDGRYLCKSSRHNMELKAGTEPERVSHNVGPERISHPVQLQSRMISGRAIEVEECVIERQPSTNIWGPLDRDSDVVIQIALQDDLKEDLFNSANEGEGQTEVDYDDTLFHEAREILCLSASEDELSSLEGDDEKSGNYAAESGRSDKQSPTSGFVSEHLEIESGNGKTLDADVVCGAKWTDAASIDEEMDTVIESGGSAERLLSDAAPSLHKPHLNQGDQSPHSVTPPSSPSHPDYGFDTCADLRKSSNKAKLNSLTYLHKMRDSVTSDSYLSDNSKKYGVKSKSRDHPFSSSSGRALQPDLSCHGNKSVYVNDAASHFSAKEWFEDSRHSAIYQKHNDLGSHADKRNSYYETSNPFPDYIDHKLSNSDSRDHHVKRPYWKGPSSEYNLDQNNRENINGNKRHVEQRPRLDHKEGRQGRLFDEKRPALQYIESRPPSRFRQWQPKSDCYLDKEGANQWKTEKHDWQFRKYGEHDDLVVQSNYESSLTQADHQKPVSSVCIRDSVEHIGDDHLSYSRREVLSFHWRSGRCDQAINGLDNMQYAEYDDDRGGRTRLWSHDSQIRPRSTCRQRLRGGSSPGDGMDQTHSRNRRNTIWDEKSYNNDPLGNYYFLDADVKMRSVDNQDFFDRRRENEECGVSRSNDKHFKSQRKDNEVFPNGLSYPYKRDKSRKSIDSQQGLNHFGKHINHRKATQGRFRMTRGHIRGKFFRSGNYGNAPQQFRSSIDSHLVGVDRKYMGKSCRASKMCNARNEYIDVNNCMKLKALNDSNVDYPVKANYSENLEVDQHAKFLNIEHIESEDIEEGQILSEELKERAMEEINSSEDLRHIGENENVYYKNHMDVNEAFKGQENPRIREILAKMERRRERFKRPITLKMDTKKETPIALHTDVETCNYSNPQRPARKRRWDGTQHLLSPLT